MSKDWQTFFVIWSYFTLPIVLNRAHRLFVALVYFWQTGGWIEYTWTNTKPPYLLRKIFK